MYIPEPEAIKFIATYMNENHQDALTQIAKLNGYVLENASIVDMSAEHLTLSGNIDGNSTKVEVKWPKPLTKREEVRVYLQQMQDDARFI